MTVPRQEKREKAKTERKEHGKQEIIVGGKNHTSVIAGLELTRFARAKIPQMTLLVTSNPPSYCGKKSRTVTTLQT